MTRVDIRALLDRHGGRPEAWPAEVRSTIEAEAARDPEAAAALAEATKLERYLAAAVEPQPVDAATIGRITSAVGRGTPHEATLRPTARLYAWASAATVASLVLGFALGVFVPQDVGESDFAGLLFGAPYEDLGESTL